MEYRSDITYRRIIEPFLANVFKFVSDYSVNTFAHFRLPHFKSLYIRLFPSGCHQVFGLSCQGGASVEYQ